ncbi:MAG: DUF4105 domain-containing protein [Bdellovibrio sp.]|nr:DUF4105 domain-containing protein [Bdellovibrio sp.]
MLIILLLFVHSTSYATDESEISEVAASQEWLKLLHYNRIEKAEFYLGSGGINSSLVELRANLEQLKSNPQYSCEFPARAKLLREKFKIAAPLCPQVENWKSKMGRHSSLSLVYVSQYVSNPASAFGHTFLLFKNSKEPLNLNVTISNAASMPEDVSNFAYIFKGITGGFPAEFSTESFYLKIQEYSNIENRDMWIYDLNFSEQQIDQLLNHIWELSKRADQGYFFLNGNCSVNSYNALAAVHSDLDFLPTGRIYVLPIETIVKAHAITQNIEYLPSLREKMFLRSQALSSAENQSFQSIIANSEPPSLTKSIEVAELTLENFELLRSRQYGTLTTSQDQAYKEALLNRAELGISSKLKIPRPAEPHHALPSTRIAASGGSIREQSFYALSAAPFYHGLLDSSPGYRPFSELILLNSTIRTMNHENKLDLTALQMANFPVITVFDSQWSWRLSLGIKSQELCNQCWLFNGEGSAGKSLTLTSNSQVFGLFGLSQEQTSSLGPQLSAGILANFSFAKLLSQFRLLHPKFNAESRHILDVSMNFDVDRNTVFEIAGHLEKEDFNYQMTLGYHF